MARTGRSVAWTLPRAASVVAVALAATGAALTIVEEVRHLSRERAVLSRWRDPAAQQRLALGPALADLVRAADAVLPSDARVLLVTAGRDTRGAEYVTFHRLLYHLPTRQLWWTAPAARDGTWESRWWTPSDSDAASLRRLAREHVATHLLFVDVEVPAELGDSVALTQNSRLVSLDGRIAPTGTPPGPPASSWAGLAAATAIVFAAGFAVVGAALRLGSRIGPVERIGLAWLTGVGSVATAMFWLSLAGLRLDRQLVVISVLTVVCWGLSHRWRRAAPAGERLVVGGWPPSAAPAAADVRSGPRWAVAAFSLIIAFSLFYVGVLAAGRPLVFWDSWVTWAMKARVFVEAGGLRPGLFEDASRVVTHLDYPLLLPLAETWLFAWATPLGATIDDRVAGGASLLFFASLLAIVHGRLLAAGLSRVSALAGTAYISCVGHLAGAGLAAAADLPLAAFALVAATIGRRWIAAGRYGDLLLAALAGGFAAWTKQEGLVLAGLVAAVLAVGAGDRRRRVLFVASLAAAVAIVAGVWWMTTGRVALPSVDFAPVTAASLASGVARVPLIASLAGGSLLTWRWSLFWPVIAMLAVAAIRRRQSAGDGALPALAACYLVVMSGAYLFSDYAPPGQHVLSSFFRLAVHVAPMAAIWATTEVDYGFRTR